MDVITILRNKRSQLESEMGRIDKAIQILNGTRCATAHRSTRSRISRYKANRPKMSAAARARIGRGVRKAFAQRKAAAAKA